MTTPTDRDIVQTATAFFDAVHSRDMDPWEDLLADDYRGCFPGLPVADRDQARAFNMVFLTAFPDLRFEKLRTAVAGDRVFVQCEASGTHDGPLATMEGDVVPATGRQVTGPMVLISEVRQGRIHREWSYWDRLDVFAQLGLAPT